ncbi:cytochrome P450 [Paenibacillus shirakamiensis]|uniref:Cytochrome P450 n=1 Tax=Paenibacillus shirakamiensis TaxID=1265935 RepID=A0ABS4JEF7_9BACL|nr:cytochrome P450 [Paenibacillus shirakamiensis]MBP2000102.1 cytochrome P450 [Paenibacillus shirakamiensis]
MSSNPHESKGSSLFTKEFTTNPFPTYAGLRETNPMYRCVFPDGQSGWMVTRYEDAVKAFKEARLIKDRSMIAGISEHQSVFTQNMLFSDPPDHKRLRGLVQKSFTPRLVEEMRGRIQEITDELLKELKGREHIHLIDEFAFPLPIIVICEILGVPAEDRDKFRLWSTSLIEGRNGEYANDMQQHMKDFIHYLKFMFEKLRDTPGSDLISQLIVSEEDGDTLTEGELYGVVTLLIIAGHETTVNLIGNTVLALLEHPEQLELLRNQPELIHSAIEESLRYNGPVEFSTSRWAREDFDFRGTRFKKGEMIIVALSSTNRDSMEFDHPNEFDITKEKSPHLAFGKGIHMCLGAPLARLEGEIAIRSLLKHFPLMKLDVDRNDLEWRPGMIVRGVKEIPLSVRE